jgi:hypothetical protein
MKRLLVILGVAALTATMIVTPVAATTTRIAFHCDETRLTEWTCGIEWIDEDFVYHSRGRQADYLDIGSPYCAGINRATVSVNLDLLTGEGTVIAWANRELSGLDGGWRAKLVAHFTPAGPYIWVGEVVGHGYGALEGYEYRSTVLETSHEATIEDGFVFLPGS